MPHGITAAAFIDLAIKILQLPWSKSIDELMLSFRFIYSLVVGEKKIPLNQSLHDAGIYDGAEVHLSIKAIWKDKIEEAEQNEEREIGTVVYDMLSRFKELERRDLARKARGNLSQSEIKSLADGCFAFIDEMTA